MEILGILVIIVLIGLVAFVNYRDYKQSPKCKWCGSKHYGRCISNPKSGKIFSNCNDGHFDYNDPNK